MEPNNKLKDICFGLLLVSMVQCLDSSQVHLACWLAANLRPAYDKRSFLDTLF
jgi:hypothetical protein